MTFDVGTGILFMKVGTHAQESLADIIARKRREIESAGMAMWGYGGSTCHPTRMVQPFIAEYSTAGRRILLVMQPMNSKHHAEPIRAEHYSRDGFAWEPVPEGIDVLGSRYALCLKSLDLADEELSLDSTRVAIGNSKGKPGNRYVKGHVDKACLEVVERGAATSEVIHIGLVARLVEPYAVFLKN